jgi:microcystin-dependent protein
MFAGNFPPMGWMFCNGELLPISENEVLFQLIGTTYGGDGEVTFALPDLRGRLPIHQGGTFSLSSQGGVEEITLTLNQIPAHTHALVGAGRNGSQASPSGNLPAGSTVVAPWASEQPGSAMSPNSIAPIGGSQPHTNLQPFLCISFIISLFGIFPSQT